MRSPSDSHALDDLRAVWNRRKWLAIVVFVFVAATGLAVALGLPNVYRSTATVLVEQPRAEAALTSEMESRLQLISQEILSRSRLEALVHGFGLYPALRQRASMEAVVEQMRRDIRTEFKAQTQPSGLGSTIAFGISYRGTDPQLVAKVANALASFYLEQEAKIRERQASGTVQVLKAQVEDVKRDLEKQERSLGAFQEQHGGELPEQAEATLANLDRLHAELRTASDERIRALDRRNELLRELAEAEGPAVAGSSGPRPAAAKLATKRDELSELSRRYSDKYPDVVRLKEEVAALEREAATEQAAGAPAQASGGARSAARLREALGEVDTEIKTFRSDETRLRAGVGEYIRRLESAPRRQRAYQEVSRDYQTTRDLYDSLRKRYEQAQLEEGEGGRTASPFRILDPAIVPTSPVAPNRMILLVVALAAALAMAAGAAGVAERLDTSLHTADDVRSFTRVPVLASIPLIVTPGDVRSRRRRFGLGVAAVLLTMGVLVHVVYDASRTSDSLVSALARGRP
jgi:polysaccharide chain length determinant protein (PEP-CTERM system associated)